MLQSVVRQFALACRDLRGVLWCQSGMAVLLSLSCIVSQCCHSAGDILLATCMLATPGCSINASPGVIGPNTHGRESQRLLHIMTLTHLVHDQLRKRK